MPGNERQGKNYQPDRSAGLKPPVFCPAVESYKEMTGKRINAMRTRPFYGSITQSVGKLVVEELFPNCVEVFFVPSREKQIQPVMNSEMPESFRAMILFINGQDDFLTIYPINTLDGHDGFLKPKYDRITCITLDGFGFGIAETVDEVKELLEGLPSGFVKDCDFGLGLLKEYRFIIDAVEEISNCSEIVISKRNKTGIDEESRIFTISYSDFNGSRKELNRITDRAQAAARTVKDVSTFNRLAFRLGVKQRQLCSKDDTLYRMVSGPSGGADELKDTDKEHVLDLLLKNKQNISRSQPEKLMKLHNDIELVTLERLIDKYEEMLGKKLNEDRWQRLFNENPFILNLAFGYPIIKVRDQATVGGRKLSGSGDKIADFLLKNSITNNTALFEIKTPQTKLLNKTAYRDGVFTPSPDLSGSINQVLDQRYQFQKEISSLKEATRIYDIESYSVHCCLLIGQTPEDMDRQKSFEQFRRNSKDVEIITFNELLAKLKQLRDFLASGEKEV